KKDKPLKEGGSAGGVPSPGGSPVPEHRTFHPAAGNPVPGLNVATQSTNVAQQQPTTTSTPQTPSTPTSSSGLILLSPRGELLQNKPLRSIALYDYVRVV